MAEEGKIHGEFENTNPGVLLLPNDKILIRKVQPRNNVLSKLGIIETLELRVCSTCQEMNNLHY